jgi:hypothetical protein
VQDKVRALVVANADRDNPLLADSILFLGPAAELTRDPPFLDMAMDEVWRAELERRAEVITGRPLPADWGRNLSTTAVPYAERD